MRKINELEEYLSDILYEDMVANTPNNFDWSISYNIRTLINSLIRFQVYNPLKDSL